MDVSIITVMTVLLDMCKIVANLFTVNLYVKLPTLLPQLLITTLPPGYTVEISPLYKHETHGEILTVVIKKA